jgi:hypothetical protein
MPTCKRNTGLGRGIRKESSGWDVERRLMIPLFPFLRSSTVAALQSEPRVLICLEKID